MIVGQRVYNGVEQKRIKNFVTKERKIDPALELFINSKLDNNSDKCCSN